ncbi:MAG: peroxiredoxin [Polyangiales bacterium]
MVDVGAVIEPIELEGDDGKKHTIRAAKGETLVVYFYPKDSTPGCTREGQAFSGLEADFAKQRAKIVGISRDSVKSHCSFKEKFELSVLLLSDPEKKAHLAFGAWGEKKNYGKVFEGTIRSTFIIDEAGKVLRVWKSVKVDGHAESVLAAVSALNGAEVEPAKAAKPAKKAADTTAASAKAPAKKPAAKKPAAKK